MPLPNDTVSIKELIGKRNLEIISSFIPQTAIMACRYAKARPALEQLQVLRAQAGIIFACGIYSSTCSKYSNLGIIWNIIPLYYSTLLFQLERGRWNILFHLTREQMGETGKLGLYHAGAFKRLAPHKALVLCVPELDLAFPHLPAEPHFFVEPP
jgi:hypothetical protein